MKVDSNQQGISLLDFTNQVLEKKCIKLNTDIHLWIDQQESKISNLPQFLI